MKRIIPYIGFILLFFTIGAGFDYDYYEYRPVFMTRTEMEGNVRLSSPRALENPGKIYLLNDLIFINEKYRGIHVINNSDPENPENVAFIVVDGCLDMSVKGDVIYVDNAIDLIAIKMSYGLGYGSGEIEVTKRIKEVFPEFQSPEGRGLNRNETIARPDNAILVRWEKNEYHES